MTQRIAVIVGSLRKASWNRKLAQALAACAPSTLSFDRVDIGELPIYNQDLDDDHQPPQAWTDFRDKMKTFDGVLFVTPEYNRSVPGVIKNAIDVGSRPYGSSIWAKKPCAVVSASISAMGGFGANHHLRQCLVFLDMPVLQQPEAYIGGVDKLFDEKGEITREGTQQFISKLMADFAQWVSIHAPA